MDVAPSRFLLVVAVFVGLGWRSSSPIHEAERETVGVLGMFPKLNVSKKLW